ncbi:hypothetical protein L1987_68657 [Smallanthus sonchifolius]|uniref:Uncharacterized protein n=1 Tax=Smallanthus sonchifolius TaxID=185202 RepID=A0ACB9B455_9ASTR|nr:hypothetical protein L1987_68657 [Smallanthus sonchifolius]
MSRSGQCHRLHLVFIFIHLFYTELSLPIAVKLLPSTHLLSLSLSLQNLPLNSLSHTLPHSTHALALALAHSLSSAVTGIFTGKTL